MRGEDAWSAAAEDALTALCADPSRTGLCSDFDGTLAAITTDPSATRPLEGVLSILDRLARTFGVVAVVSGRTGAFLSTVLDRRARAPELRVFGLYGLEVVASDGSVETPPSLAPWKVVIDAAAGELARVLPEVPVENKGFSTTLNWRQAPERAGAALEVAQACALRHDLVVREARMGVELVPKNLPDKGSVVAELFVGCNAACVLGDDLGDLAAFRALGGIGAPVTVRIAVGSDEAPSELLAQADLVLQRPTQARDFLAALADRTRA